MNKWAHSVSNVRLFVVKIYRRMASPRGLLLLACRPGPGPLACLHVSTSVLAGAAPARAGALARQKVSIPVVR